MRIIVEVEVRDVQDFPERIIGAIEELCPCDPCFFDFITARVEEGD